MTLETGRKALVYDSTIANVVVENGQYAAPLKTFADINLGFEYQLEKLSLENVKEGLINI